MDKVILDGKGKVIGREVSKNVTLDGHGRLVGRYIESSDRTVDNRGRNVGVGDQRERLLGK